MGATPLESHLVACVQENLALQLLDNAIFLCERLVAEFPSERNIYLLASCYHRAQQIYRAYHLLKGLEGAQCRYLFALCCIEMGKLSEAESVLMPNNDISRIPNGAAGYFLLGRVFQLSNRHNVAIAYFNTALQLDPMMWCAHEELCQLGAEHETQQFVNTPQPQAPQQQRNYNENIDTEMVQQSTSERPPRTEQGVVHPTGCMSAALLRTPTDDNGGEHQIAASGPTPAVHQPHSGPTVGWNTVASGARSGWPTRETPSFATPGAGVGHPSGPPPAPRGNNIWPPTTNMAPSGSTPPALAGWLGNATHARGPAMAGRKILDEGKMRKISSKLFAEPASILKHVAAPPPGTAQHSTGANIKEEETASLLAMSSVSGVPRGEKSLEGQAGAVALLQLLGEAYRLTCAFKCQEAVDAFNRLPLKHLQTGWALMNLGRAYFEMVDYNGASMAFQRAREVDPYRLRGLEVYSTVLWHMKREIELSALAQEAVAMDLLSPSAWCVMGNCFSLQKEHETALRFFQRALQLDPSLPYAYTLCGHEYFANEDFEKGIACYRNAIRIDPRHYNAWFGMGHIYYRQEKYGMAEYHFRRAHTINPRSSVLRCYLGMALHKLKRNAEALEALDAAIHADPRNPLARFERAGVLTAEDRLEAALQELQALRDVAPREASVLFHMGKVLKKMGRIQDALAAFCDALDLQPPSADTNIIKAAIDRVAVVDAEDDEDI